MNEKYIEWHEEVTTELKKNVLMTLSHIVDRRKKSELNYMTSQQLDDAKDCMDILMCISKLHHQHGHMGHMHSGHGGAMAAGAAARPVGVGGTASMS